MRKKTVKRLTRLAIIIIALGLIYAIAVAVSAAKLRHAYAAIEKAGRPMDRGDVIPKRIPDSENAAPLYESAILYLGAQPIETERWRNRLDPKKSLLEYLGELSEKFMVEDLPPDKQDEFQQLIRRDSVTLAMSIVEQAAQRRSCRFDHDYDAGLNILLTHLGKMRNLARILAAKGLLEAQTGSPESAWDKVPTQLKLADGLLNEPLIVSQLVRIRMIERACRTIRKLYEIAPPTEQQSRDIADLLEAYDSIQPMVRAIDGERVLLDEWVFNLPKKRLLNEDDIIGSSFGFFKIFKIYFKPTFLADHAAYLRMSLEFAKRIERPYSSEEMQVLEKFQEENERYPITNALTPAMHRVKEIQCEMLAELHITRTGLALLQYKRSEGAFPETLETLNLSNMIDPFSNELLRYKPQTDGFILYSIGPDQKDNEGNPKQKDQKDDWDIVWQFPGIEVPKVKSTWGWLAPSN
jgi:hypothetical protein